MKFTSFFTTAILIFFFLFVAKAHADIFVGGVPTTFGPEDTANVLDTSREGVLSTSNIPAGVVNLNELPDITYTILYVNDAFLHQFSTSVVFHTNQRNTGTPNLNNTDGSMDLTTAITGNITPGWQIIRNDFSQGGFPVGTLFGVFNGSFVNGHTTAFFGEDFSTGMVFMQPEIKLLNILYIGDNVVMVIGMSVGPW
jgi:hypothetical protein